jgi:hypothetical protein
MASRSAHRDDGNGRAGDAFLDPDRLLDGVLVERVDGRGHPLALERAGDGIDLDIAGGGRLLNADDDMDSHLSQPYFVRNFTSELKK